MPEQPPILVVEDDPEDQQLLLDVFEAMEINNPVIFLNNGLEAFLFLQATVVAPLVILCDVNMPKMNGFELRRKIDSNEKLKRKSIPFLFFSTTANNQVVKDAYDLTVQGFFIKPKTLESLEYTLKLIIDYWKLCLHPNSTTRIT